MSLKEYKQKRNFKQTAEPGARKVSRQSAKAQPKFVIQKHDASHLHYDFRLEMDGVLKSWAVPKGFPLQRGERRLAVQVEDHPLDYAEFEGTIASGNYGAGTVMVWDNGTYQVAGDKPLNAIESGKLHLTLHGTKLKGDWTLVQMHSRKEKDRRQWLLMKSGVDQRPIPPRIRDQSVLTKRSLEQIASHPGREWKSNRQKATDMKPIRKPDDPPAGPIRLPRAKVAFVPPMKCKLVEVLPKGPEWILRD